MKEYFVIFILFTIFILYSVTLVSKDLNRMRCIEGFEDTYTFAQLFSSDENRANLCSTTNQHIDFSTDGSSTYQLQCYDQCSTDNTDIPVTTNGSNCKIPSDSNTSNCEVTVSAKCYLDGAFHEASSNVNMYCPDSGYADCAPCVIPSPRSDCSIDGGTCQRTDLVTLPTGYARCILDSNLDGLTYLEGDSNVRFACLEQACLIDGSGRGYSLTRITDGSCSTLDCYGNADYSGDRFDITGKVLGIKIPSNSIKTHYHANGTLDYKYVILNFNRHTHDGKRYLDMSVGICKDTNKLMKPLSTNNIDSIKQIFEDNVVDDKNNHPKNKRHIEWPVTGNNSIITTMDNDPRSAEVITLRGGGYGLYFNFIKEGNKFDNFWNADKVTGSDQDRELWVYDNPIRVRFEFRKNSTTVAFIHRNRDDYNMNGNANVSFTQSADNVADTNITDHYIFLKGGPSENLHVSNLSFS